MTLELDRITKRYGEKIALDQLSLRVEPGRMFGFVGPNGAGKTTAMRITLGLLAADSGQVRWCGRPLDQTVRSSHFGYMPEERGLYPRMRVHRQLCFMAELHGLSRPQAHAAAWRWLEEFGLTDRATERVEALSLGNQQRVQLIVTLIHSPDVLVLDEPFSGLDPLGTDLMAAMLKARVAEGAAVIFSSHQLELVERLCDVVGIIKAGRIITAGTIEELRDSADRPLRIRIRVDAPDGWAEGLSGVTILGRRGDATLLELAEGVSDQAVLDHARSWGPVSEFTETKPTLAELFREAVAA